jgi:hypothetical protein
MSTRWLPPYSRACLCRNSTSLANNCWRFQCRYSNLAATSHEVRRSPPPVSDGTPYTSGSTFPTVLLNTLLRRSRKQINQLLSSFGPLSTKLTIQSPHRLCQPRIKSSKPSTPKLLFFIELLQRRIMVNHGQVTCTRESNAILLDYIRVCLIIYF